MTVLPVQTPHPDERLVPAAWWYVGAALVVGAATRAEPAGALVVLGWLMSWGVGPPLLIALFRHLNPHHFAQLSGKLRHGSAAVAVALALPGLGYWLAALVAGSHSDGAVLLILCGIAALPVGLFSLVVTPVDLLLGLRRTGR